MQPKGDSMTSSTPTTERIQTILGLIKGPRVLHVGCCGTYFPKDALERQQWIHQFLVDQGNQILGGDINEDALETMRLQGFEVMYLDAQAIPAQGEQFDTIIAGELIEHLENPGAFLRGCHNRLKCDGRLVISTPNVFTPMNFLGNIAKYDRWANPEHTCWYDPQTIASLLDRCGFCLKELKFVDNILPDPARAYAPLALFAKTWKAGRAVIPARFRTTMVIHAELADRPI
jgi:SAM-dependent methyltransferase